MRSLMKPEPRRRGSGKPGSPAHTTADSTPTLSAAILAMSAGAALDELVGRSVLGLAQPGRPRGLSTTWHGPRQVVAGLTNLPCYVQAQIPPPPTLSHSTPRLSRPPL